MANATGVISGRFYMTRGPKQTEDARSGLETSVFWAMDGCVNEPDELKQRPKRRWIDRILRFVPFPFVVAMSFLLIVCFPFWMYLDAHYRDALTFIGINLGIEKLGADPYATEIGMTDLVIEYANEWDHLGSRIKLFYLLFLLAMTSGLFVVIHLSRRPTLRRVGIALFLSASWAGLYFSHSTMVHWTVKQHCQDFLPKVKLATAVLTTVWPEKSGRIFPWLDLIVVPDHPNYLLVTSKSDYSLGEGFGYAIQRSQDGALRFGLDPAYDYNLEYHPPGSLPSSYESPLSGQTCVMSNWTQLEEKWYLVWYSQE